MILEAAEAEFLEKGYDGAKMLSIARRAGVAHSMLHYYYRSKENLFQAVMLRKTREIVPMFKGVFEEDLPFEETLNRMREARDRYIFSQSPQRITSARTRDVGQRGKGGENPPDFGGKFHLFVVDVGRLFTDHHFGLPGKRGDESGGCGEADGILL